MLRIFVDSGSSIKQDEKEKYNVEIIPLIVTMKGKSYQDGIDLSNEEFYSMLINEKIFPKTSLPNMEEVINKVESFTSQGDDVLIITISSKISGTFNAFRLVFEDNEKVHVFDSEGAVGKMRLLVEEANRYRDTLPIEEIIKKLEELRPRIHIMAIPETLEYLALGGRLSKVDKILGTILGIKPIIGFENGEVKALIKKRGLKSGMQAIVAKMEELHCDIKHSIIASYSYCKDNLMKLISMVDKKYLSAINCYDDIDLAIACHWGPNAFGFVFVGDKI